MMFYKTNKTYKHFILMCFYKKEEVDIEKWEVEDNFEIRETEERGRKFETVKARHDGDTLL